MKIRNDYFLNLQEHETFGIPVFEDDYYEITIKDEDREFETKEDSSIEDEEFNTWVLLDGTWKRCMSIDFE